MTMRIIKEDNVGLFISHEGEVCRPPMTGTVYLKGEHVNVKPSGAGRGGFFVALPNGEWWVHAPSHLVVR